MKNVKTIFLFMFCFGCQLVCAQSPKWAEKAREAVFSIVTYDADNKILNTGNGFFVTEDGVALSAYSLFRGAQRAVAINGKGEQMPVALIMGADDMYDVIKFRVDIPKKKVKALSLASASLQVGANVYLLPYSTRKDRSCPHGTVKGVDGMSDNYTYYTLNLKLNDKMANCPLTNEEGEVIGLVQKSSGKDTATICYAVDARFAMSRSISAFSYSDLSLKGVGIKKALPDTEDEALVFLYMVSSQLSADKYLALLNDFVETYPESTEGYLRRSAQQLSISRDDESMKKVEADLDRALEVADEKADVYYNRARTIYNYLLTAPEKPYNNWTFDSALDEVHNAMKENQLPLYQQLEGDIQYARGDYAAALACYEAVNKTNFASASTFFSAARAKQMMAAPPEEVLVLMDSCVAQFTPPYVAEAAPYLIERAQVRMQAGQARQAMHDYDEYYQAMKGDVNDVFYYMREQAALKARQYQRALDDLDKAIELAPDNLTYRAELAVVNIRVNRNEEAISVLQDALKIDSTYAEAYRLMGLAQVQLKRNDEACANFAKAKELGHPQVDDLIEKYCK